MTTRKLKSVNHNQNDESHIMQIGSDHDGNYKWYHINVNMLPAKLAYFSENAREMSYVPALILFLTGIGLTKTESGYIIGFRLIGRIIGGPFWGVIADKWKNHRTIIVIISTICLLMMCSQPFISTIYGNQQLNQCPLPFSKLMGQSCNVTCQSNSTNCNTTTLCDLQNVALSQQTVESKPFGKLFFVIFTMQFLVSFCESFLAFIDTATIRKSQLSTQRKVEYGLQRMWAAPGAIVGVTVTNIIISNSPFSGVTCEAGLFVAFGAFTILTTIALMLLYKNLQFKTPDADHKNNKQFWKALLKTIKNKQMIVFFVVAFLGGMADTPDRFFFLYLKDLNSPKAVYTLIIVVAASTAFIGFFLSGRIIQFLGGTWKALTFSFFWYAIQTLGYSLISNAWLVLICELLHIICFVLFLATSLTYVKETSPDIVLTTLASIFNVLKFGIGPMVGSSIAGVIYEKYSAVILFKCLAVMEFIVVVILGVLSFTIFQPKQIKKDSFELIENNGTLLKES